MTLIWFVYIRSTLHARSILRALPVERGEKDRDAKGKLEAHLASTCFLIGGPQIFFVGGCNVLYVSERVQKSRKSIVSLSKDHDFQIFRPKLDENQAKFGKIDQNLGKSLSKGPKNIKILSLKGSVFDFCFRYTCHLANIA